MDRRNFLKSVAAAVISQGVAQGLSQPETKADLKDLIDTLAYKVRERIADDAESLALSWISPNGRVWAVSNWGNVAWSDDYCATWNEHKVEEDWVSVEERLPDKTGQYLVHLRGVVEGLSVTKLEFVPNTSYVDARWCVDGRHTFDGVVTHWRPWPAPPKMWSRGRKIVQQQVDEGEFDLMGKLDAIQT